MIQGAKWPMIAPVPLRVGREMRADFKSAGVSVGGVSAPTPFSSESYASRIGPR